jgi:hypothetical protein
MHGMKEALILLILIPVMISGAVVLYLARTTERRRANRDRRGAERPVTGRRKTDKRSAR